MGGISVRRSRLSRQPSAILARWPPRTGWRSSRRSSSAGPPATGPSREDEVHPDAELHTRLAAAAGEPYRGREGIERWGRDLGEHLGDDGAHGRGDDRDRRRARSSSSARPSSATTGSDVTFTQPIAWLFTFRDDLPARMDVFQSHAEGRKAAGLL